jgi:hypothetical protein
MLRDATVQVPSAEEHVRHHVIGIERNRRRWSGSWRVADGKLYVESGYGSRTAPAGAERGREAKARKLLCEIVDMRVRP